MATTTTAADSELTSGGGQGPGPGMPLSVRLRTDARLAAIVLLLPAVLILVGLLGYPLVLGVWLSLTNQTIGYPGSFVGLDNFVNLVQDPVFRTALFNTVLYTVVSIAFKYVLGMALALLLNHKLRFKGFLRAVFLLPWVVPTVLSAIAWWWMFDSQFSIISWVGQQLGFIDHNINFLGQPWNARWSVIAVDIWRGTPFFAISLLAGLQTVPSSLHEAADMDGATSWQRFRYVTLPMLSGITAIVVTFSAIFTFSDFSLVYSITRGGPNNATQLLATLAYQRAIQGGNLSEGAAIAMFMVPVLFVFTLLTYFKVTRRKW
ncbi:MAG TPA: sugar ABC transporter permease [Nocardioidaceae bacterium]